MDNRDFDPSRENRTNRDYTGQYSYKAPGTGDNIYTGEQEKAVPVKKRTGWLKVTAACLAVVIICGAVGLGGAAAWKGLRDMFVRVENIEGGTVMEDVQETIQEKTEEVTAGLKTFAKESQAMTPSEIYAQYVESVVSIKTESTAVNIFGQVTRSASAGTGFIITADGYILTNNHVVENATAVTVTLNDGSEYKATVMGADNDSDVAVLKIDAGELKPVNLGDSDDIVVGEDVAVIGNPLGELTNSLSTGVISALDREISIEAGLTINMFQIDAAVNAGNSGGPVFDSTGRVIGVVTAKYATSTVEGLGFAIPINDAVNVAEKLIENGYVPTGEPTMNIMVRTLDAATAAYYDVPVGAYVIDITAGGCCHNAGMQVGDIITNMGSTEISTKEDLSTAKEDFSPGDTAVVTVYRNGEFIDLNVVLDELGAPVQETFNPFG